MSKQNHPDGVDVLTQSWSLPMELSRRYAGLGTFIETGTYEGGGVQQALDAGFQRVYSIEPHRGRYGRCRERFAADPRVTLHLGPSAYWLPGILAELAEPACVFLDAHGFRPGDPWPLLAELGLLQLAPCRDHVVIVDDMGLLYGRNDWSEGTSPDQVHTAIKRINPAYRLRLENNKTGRLANILVADFCDANPNY